MSNFSIFIKGLVVGASMLLPGVSGGTMAMLLSIYDSLISWVTSITRFKFKNLPRLILFSVAGVLGMVLFASPLKTLVDLFEKPTMFFFMGAIAGGVPLIYKKAEVEKLSPKLLVYPAIGVGIIILFTCIPEGFLQVDLSAGASGYLILFAVGLLISIALVLPGVSTSMMLLVLGLHSSTLEAISKFNLAFLLPLGIGAVIGILLCANILDTLMTKYPQASYLVILGFVLGSLVELQPGIPSGLELVLCLILFVCAFILMSFISNLGEQKEKSSENPNT